VKPPVAIAKAVAVVVPGVRLGKTEHTLDCTHGTADTSADCASNHAADGTRDPISFVGAFLGATHDTLGVAGMGHDDERQRQTQQGKHERQRPAGRNGYGRNLGFPHLNSLKSGRTRRLWQES
jgi:hypothetical protein